MMEIVHFALGNPNAHDIIRANGCPNGSQHLNDNSNPILHGAAVFIRSAVGVIGYELIEQIAVCRMDFNPVESSSLSAERRLRKILDRLFNLRLR